MSYVVLQQQRLALTTDLPGRTSAYRVADIRPQVGGVVQKRLFVEGADVKADQQLYQIDAAPYRAALASADATQKKAEANAVSTRLLATRYKALVDDRAVSQQDYDNAVASQGQAEAEVGSGKAGVQTAQINVVYTRVLAPITGRIGRSMVTEGALVTANQATAMATIQQIDPIYVDVTQPSTTLLRLRREMAEGKITSAGRNRAPVTLMLEDGTIYPHRGALQFSEVTVDQGTGSVTLRAEFPNPDRVLLPGMFVHERIEEGVDEKALLAPQQAVTRNQRGEPTALVVGSDGKAELRVLQLGTAIGDQWQVTAGLAAGDKLIVQGLQAAKPQAAVQGDQITLDALRKASAAKPTAAAGGGQAGSDPAPGKPSTTASR